MANWDSAIILVSWKHLVALNIALVSGVFAGAEHVATMDSSWERNGRDSSWEAMLAMRTGGVEAAVVVAVGAFAVAVVVVAMASWDRSWTKQRNNYYCYCHYSYCNGCIAAAAAETRCSGRCCCLATGHDAVAAVT